MILAVPFVVLIRPTVNLTGRFVNPAGSVRENLPAVRGFGGRVREVFQLVREFAGQFWVLASAVRRGRCGNGSDYSRNRAKVIAPV